MSQKDKKKKQKQVYVVKDIIGYKVEDGQEWFLIYWEGYPKSQATWQTIQSFNPDDDELVDEMVRPWRERYRAEQSQEEKTKKNEDTQNRSRIQTGTQIPKKKRQLSEEVWQKLALGFIEQAQKMILKDENAKQNAQNSEKVHFNQIIMIKKNYQQPENISNNDQKYSQDSSSEVRSSKKKKIKKSQQHRKKKLLIAKAQKNLPQMQFKKQGIKSIFEKLTKAQKNLSQKQMKTQGIKSIFEKLPVTKIVDKISVDGKDLFQLQIEYNQVLCSGIYLHSVYVSQIWPELLAEFEQNNQKKQAELEIEEEEKCEQAKSDLN